MKQFTYIITDEAGIHARPAGLLVKEAAKFTSTTTIAKGAKKGDLKRIFGVMALGVKRAKRLPLPARVLMRMRQQQLWSLSSRLICNFAARVIFREVIRCFH